MKGKRKGRKKGLAMIGAFAVLLLLAGLGSRITASAKAKMEREELLEYCRIQEQVLVQEVREFLAEKGYRDSGVMLTRVWYEDGSIEYRLKVHHRRIDRMDGEQQAQLLEELSAFTFLMDNCRFVPIIW